MFYVKIALIVLWLALISVIGTCLALFSWGNLDLSHYYGRAFSWGAQRILGVRVNVEGLQILQDLQKRKQPVVIVANHQSIVDIVAYGAIYPKRTLLIGKKQLLWIPFFGIFYVAAGNVLIDRNKKRKAMAGMAQAADRIKEKGVCFWIFPEGTRNPKHEELLPFKRGAFYAAIRAQVPILPIVCEPIHGKLSWRSKRASRGVIHVRILPPVSVKGYAESASQELADEVRGKMQVAFHGLARIIFPENNPHSRKL